MPRSAQEVEALLRRHGFVLTSQRRAIVRHLLSHGGHWTASELQAAVPQASRATVYTTLSLLRELGAVAALAVAGGEVRYDANPDPHHHVLCTRCGRIEDVPETWLPVQPRQGAELPFRVERFRVVAEGVCPACASSQA